MTKYPAFTLTPSLREGLVELIEQTDILIANIANHNLLYSYFLTDLKMTGLRFNELLNKSFIYSYDEVNVIFMTEKGSANRTIKRGELTPYFNNYILNEQSKYFLSSVANFYIIYNRSNFPWIMKHEKKWLSTHIFRHIKAKKLYSEGKTRKEIQEYFGEADIKNSDGYIDSVIDFYEYVLND